MKKKKNNNNKKKIIRATSIARYFHFLMSRAFLSNVPFPFQFFQGIPLFQQIEEEEKEEEEKEEEEEEEEGGAVKGDGASVERESSSGREAVRGLSQRG